MDTISSRESNGSPLPLVGAIAGVLGLVLGIVAVVKVSNANKRLDEEVKPKIDLVDGIGAKADAANDAAGKVKTDLAKLQSSTQSTVNQIGDLIGGLRADVDKLKDEVKKPAPAAAKGGSSGPVVAGPGEYVVKAGDSSGTKIARANNVSIQDLQAVNPGVDWNHLKVGQKLKLPKK